MMGGFNETIYELGALFSFVASVLLSGLTVTQSTLCILPRVIWGRFRICAYAPVSLVTTLGSSSFFT